MNETKSKLNKSDGINEAAKLSILKCRREGPFLKV